MIETLNPYLISAYLVVQRLVWDLRPAAWRSRAMLTKMRDSQADGTAVILCNGPSLLKTDFDLVQGSGAFVIGLNKINLLFDKTPLRPQAIVAVNPYVIEQNQEFYNQTDIPLFLDSVAARHVRTRRNVTFLHSSSIRWFAKDVRMSVCQGHTVTFVALQLAYHLGFRRVALVGCDHNFAQQGPANLLVKAGEKDESHFDPRYFSNGVQWQLPDLLQSEIHYLLAREAFESDGRLVANATVGGKLEIFQRMSLEAFLSGDVAA